MIDLAALKAYAVIKYLSGVHNAKEIAKMAGLDEDGERLLSNYFQTTDFQVQLKRSKADMSASVVDTIKEQLHSLLDMYLSLAKDCTDPRVRAAVIRDLLDRGGTGAAQKFALTSPEAYRKKLEQYSNDDGGSTNPGNIDAPGDGKS